MWKESYRIGIDRIDQQHIELFRMADALLKDIEENAQPEKFHEAISFLKDYVVFHFKDEEAYQASIGYAGIKEHQKAHRDFTNSVLEFESRLENSNYDIKVVKDLAGTLTTWLIYHVADADQKIAGKHLETQMVKDASCFERFVGSIKDVMQKMAGIDLAALHTNLLQKKEVQGDILVSLEVTGEVPGQAIFGFSKELAFSLIEIMTFTTPDTIDELVCSALAELSNITGGNVVVELSEGGINADIKPPVVDASSLSWKASKTTDCAVIETGHGSLEVAFCPA